MKNLIYLSLILLSFSSCKVTDAVKKDTLSKSATNPATNSNYVYLDDIENGKSLNRANVISNKKFFEYLMNNELGNPHNKPVYETLLTTSDKIYFGVVKKAPGTGNLIVDPFFATDNEKILEYFPGYEDINGSHVRAKVFYSFFEDEIQSKLRPVCENSYSYHYSDYDIELTNVGIVVKTKFQGKCYEEVYLGIDLLTVLNPSNLDVIESYYILKDRSKGEQIEEGHVGPYKDVLNKGYKDKTKKQY